jgi:hypothetical protein
MAAFIWNCVSLYSLIAIEASREFGAGEIAARKIFGGLADRARAPPATATRTGTEMTTSPGLHGPGSTLAIAFGGL